MSEETEAFTANLVVIPADKKKCYSFSCRNDGRGGMTNVYSFGNEEHNIKNMLSDFLQTQEDTELINYSKKSGHVFEKTPMLSLDSYVDRLLFEVIR